MIKMVMVMVGGEDGGDDVNSSDCNDGGDDDGGSDDGVRRKKGKVRGK